MHQNQHRNVHSYLIRTYRYCTNHFCLGMFLYRVGRYGAVRYRLDTVSDMVFLSGFHICRFYYENFRSIHKTTLVLQSALFPFSQITYSRYRTYGTVKPKGKPKINTSFSTAEADSSEKEMWFNY